MLWGRLWRNDRFIKRHVLTPLACMGRNPVMVRRRICLVHHETREPLLRTWTPSVSHEEFINANRRLEARGLPWRWIYAAPDPCSDSTPASSPSPARS
jgi:hypothetical protein